jgi:DNA-binding beta-propeller fold protein YncE
VNGKEEFLAVVGIVAAGSILIGRPAVAAAPAVRFGPCGTFRVAAESRLTSVPWTMVTVSDSPFGVVAARGGWIFVSAETSKGGYVAVISDRGLALTLVRTVDLPVALASGLSLTPDGRYLLVAGGDRTGPKQAVVLSVARLEEGQPQPVLGVLKARFAVGWAVVSSAIEVTSSKDGRYVFVANEGVLGIAVFNLHHAVATRFASSGYVGRIPVDNSTVGMALSPDGRTLYATSKSGRYTTFPSKMYGTLSVINVAKAESRPQEAVVSTAAAGCDSVRVAASPDGKTVWVTAAGSDQLLAFSSQKLVRDPTHALIAAVPVGAQPVGVATFDHGRRVAVADSARSGTPGSTSRLTIVNANAALNGSHSLIGYIPAGTYPRNLTVEPNGTTLLATNYRSGQLEAVDLQQLG